ncbi:MAG: permease [Candidatus Omnitrophota bacterium]
MQIAINFLKEILSLWLEVSPYLLLGMVFAGLLHVFLGKEFITRQLGKAGIGSVIKATLLGIPLPVCSCGVIPVVSSLRKDGAHKSSILSFLVSTPTTGIDSILASYSLLGPLFALFRPLGAALAGIILGVLDYIIEGKDEQQKAIPEHDHPKLHIVFRGKEFLRYCFLEIPQDIGKALIIGIVAGGAISAFIPQELFSQYVSFPFDFIVALVIGIPLYVCATGSIPVAVTLIQKGFSPGAGLVFLIVGPATNAITLSFVRAKLGKKSFYLYLITIIVVAVVLGFVFNYVWATLGEDSRLVTGGGKMLPEQVKIICGLIMAVLIGNGLRKEKTCSGLLNPDLEIIVPDMDCDHCKITLENKLKELDGITAVHIDIPQKSVKITGKIDKQLVINKIIESGYTPQKLN